MQWLPINTAPKDEWIIGLTHNPETDACFIKWLHSHEVWVKVDGSYLNNDLKPTHWIAAPELKDKKPEAA